MNDRRPPHPRRPAAPERGQRRPANAPKSAPKSEDGLVCVTGIGAARAVLRLRPEDVVSLAYAPEVRGAVADLLRDAARHHIAYREVSRDELSRMADTIHHEGVSLRVRPKRAASLLELTHRLAKRGFVLALDQVDNPHNVGALLRTAAYFGAEGLLLSGEKDLKLGPAVMRVAEGGAESVPLCSVARLADALTTLKAAGAVVIGADAHQGTSLRQFSFPERTVLVLGSERHGLSPEVKRRCDAFVRIEG
ncbi:MAG: hypothetical protein RL385_4106, partial [Pseudomonadota bacterium]